MKVRNRNANSLVASAGTCFHDTVEEGVKCQGGFITLWSRATRVQMYGVPSYHGSLGATIGGTRCVVDPPCGVGSARLLSKAVRPAALSEQ